VKVIRAAYGKVFVACGELGAYIRLCRAFSDCAGVVSRAWKRDRLFSSRCGNERETLGIR
jgi:hypothetical protein